MGRGERRKFARVLRCRLICRGAPQENREAEAFKSRPCSRPRQGAWPTRPVCCTCSRREGQPGVRSRAQGLGERAHWNGHRRVHGERGAALRAGRCSGRISSGRTEAR